MFLEYYLSSDYRADGNYDRSRDYGLRYTPTVCFNGRQNVAVGADSYDKYKSRVDSEKANGTSIAITAVKTVSGSKTTIDAEIQNTSASEMNDVEVWFAVYDDLGSSLKHYVVRALESGGTIDTMSAGETRSFSQDFDLLDANMPNVEAVVFLQNTDSKTMEVIQVALAT